MGAVARSGVLYCLPARRHHGAGTACKEHRQPALDPLILKATRRCAAALLIAGLTLGWPQLASAGEGIIVLREAPGGVGPGWGGWLGALTRKTGLPVHLHDLAPWPGEPAEGQMDEARAAFKKGEDAFLALDMREAAAAFEDAERRFDALLTAHPFSLAVHQSLSRSAFFKVHALIQGRQRREGRKALSDLLSRHPLMEPDPGIFPPDFCDEVTAARRRLVRKDKVSPVTLRLTPPDALISVEGQPLAAEGGALTAPLPAGPSAIKVGWPGVGVQAMDFDPSGPGGAAIDLLAWPEALPRTKAGVPASPALIEALRGRGFESLIWITEGGPLGLDGPVIFAHRLSDGGLTAVVALSGEDPSAAAVALGEALGTRGVEVLRCAPDGSVVEDEALEDALEALVSVKVEGGPGPEPSEGPRVRLGLELGAGLGVATQVTNPGLAPTLMVLRPDLALILESGRVDLGISGRLQLVDFSALVEPYVRCRLGGVNVRAGLGIGEINHRIVETENRRTSTQGFIGPTLGLELPLGPVVIGASLLAPLHPAPTIHVDLTIGLAFDL